MAYDPEASLIYGFRQREKKRMEEERKRQEVNVVASGDQWCDKNEPQYDHPDTMENGTATLFYIIVMLVGAIFIDRLLIWGMASFIYFKFITRHHKKK